MKPPYYDKETRDCFKQGKYPIQYYFLKSAQAWNKLLILTRKIINQKLGI